MSDVNKDLEYFAAHERAATERGDLSAADYWRSRYNYTVKAETQRRQWYMGLPGAVLPWAGGDEVQMELKNFVGNWFSAPAHQHPAHQQLVDAEKAKALAIINDGKAKWPHVGPPETAFDEMRLKKNIAEFQTKGQFHPLEDEVGDKAYWQQELLSQKAADVYVPGVSEAEVEKEIIAKEEALLQELLTKRGLVAVDRDSYEAIVDPRIGQRPVPELTPEQKALYEGIGDPKNAHLFSAEAAHKAYVTDPVARNLGKVSPLGGPRMGMHTWQAKD